MRRGRHETGCAVVFYGGCAAVLLSSAGFIAANSIGSLYTQSTMEPWQAGLLLLALLTPLVLGGLWHLNRMCRVLGLWAWLGRRSEQRRRQAARRAPAARPRGRTRRR